MRPAARVQAAIELLDAIIDGARNQGAPADRLVAEYFRARRYAGSKDRRAVRELVYRAIRACGPVPPSGRSAMLALAQDDPALLDLFDGSRHGPAPVEGSERPAETGLAPSWLMDALSSSGVSGEVADALLDRAPLDIRVNSLKAERETLVLPAQGEYLAAVHGLRFETGTNIDQWEAYRDGLIEVQDHGSQLAGLAFGAQPGETVIDLCAGAGGKTLALAAQMNNVGELIACDTDRARLSKLGPRASRAGVTIAETLLLNPQSELDALAGYFEQADLVLVDAPCSGTGTWRRNPEGRWRITPAQVDRLSALQDRLLDIAVGLTKPGGRIGFVTCSLLDSEGRDRIEAFLGRHAEWQSAEMDLPLGRNYGSGWRLDPFHDGTDGFFVAMLRSSC